MFLIVVGHKIALSDWGRLLWGFQSCKVICRIAVLELGTICIRCFVIEIVNHPFQVVELAGNELLEIVSDKPKKFLSLVQFSHCFIHIFVISGKNIRWLEPVINEFMQKMPYVGKYSSVSAAVRVRHSWPVKFKQTSVFSLVYVSLVDSLNSLSFESQQMLNRCLGMRMSKTISGPADFSLDSKVLPQKLVSECVLIDDVVDVGDCFVVFDPSAISDFQLSVADKLSGFCLLFRRDRIVPVF